MLARYHLRAGSSLDLRTGWDLSKASEKQRAADHIEKEDPELLICSPPCTLFSRLNALNRHVLGLEWADERDTQRMAAPRHIEFCIQMIKGQLKRGKHFVFEHPYGADSWELDCLIKVRKMDVFFSNAKHSCASLA